MVQRGRYLQLREKRANVTGINEGIKPYEISGDKRWPGPQVPRPGGGCPPANRGGMGTYEKQLHTCLYSRVGHRQVEGGSAILRHPRRNCANMYKPCGKTLLFSLPPPTLSRHPLTFLTPSWGHLGPSWPSLGPSWAMGSPWGPPCTKMCKNHKKTVKKK